MRVLKSATVLMLILTALAVLGLAVPNISVQIQGVGSSTTPVYSPTGSGGFYFWISTATYNILNVTLMFADNLSAGTTIYVKLYNSSGDLIAVWSRTLTRVLPALEEINVSPSTQVSIYDVSDIHIVLDSPDYVSGAGSFQLLVKKIGVGLFAGDICNPIAVNNPGIAPLYNYTIKVALNSTSDVLWGYINSTNVYFTTSTGSPLYYWVQQLDSTNEHAVLWVKVPYIPAGESVVVCMHYGGTNPYSSYNDPHRTFLLFDDFDGTSVNTTRWNVHGTPSVSGGILYMSGVYQIGWFYPRIYGNSTWIWTKINLPSSYEVIMNASLSYPDWGIAFGSNSFTPGPFYAIYINATSGIGYGETIEYDNNLNEYDALTRRSIINGSGTVLDYINNPYTLNTWSIFEIYVNSNSTVYTYQDGTLVVWYTLNPSYVTSGPFGFGQITGRTPSEYDWIAIRKHASPEPTVTVGHWYGALVYYPSPPG